MPKKGREGGRSETADLEGSRHARVSLLLQRVGVQWKEKDGAACEADAPSPFWPSPFFVSLAKKGAYSPDGNREDIARVGTLESCKFFCVCKEPLPLLILILLIKMIMKNQIFMN